MEDKRWRKEEKKREKEETWRKKIRIR